jgi:hypothetical protein
MTEQELVKLCLAQICKRLGFDVNQRLTQRDLEFICDHIEEKTNVLISLSTMKRLINGQFSRLPQVATLNAISHYLGYESWQDFKQQQKQETKESHPFNQVRDDEPLRQQADAPPLNANLPAVPSVAERKRKWPLRYKMIGAATIVVVAVVILAYKTLSIHPATNYDKVPFSARKTTSNDIPNTVIFNYNIDQLEGDSFFIQQAWDKNRRVRIYKKNYTLTDIYFLPGYHKAKLIVNDKIVKTVDVSIPTNGWFFFAHKNLKGSMPEYIIKDHAAKNGVLGMEKEDLVKHQVNSAEEYNYCYTWFPGKQEVSSDNFIFKTRVRVINLNNAVCPRFMPEVFTQSSFLFFRATPAGCTSDIDALFGEHYLSGKTNDLSGFGCDVTQWQDYEMVVKNRQATVRINNKEVLKKQYTESVGLITGIGFASNGLMEIDYVDLKSLDGKVVYSNKFDQ